MTARFTETAKWADPWFRKLTPKAKATWEYLRDNCDSAGVLEFDFESACFHIGLTPKDLEGALKELERGFIAASGYLMLRTFLKHQKNVPLNENNPAHRGIIRRLEEVRDIFPEARKQIDEHGIIIPIEGASKELTSPSIRGLCISKGIGNGKGKGKERFRKPTPQEVTDYSKEIDYPLDGEAWCDCYEQKDWMVGKSRMKDWRAAVRNWKRNGWTPSGGRKGKRDVQFDGRKALGVED